MERYRDNPNAPQVSFIRKNGRVIPIIKGKSNGVKKRTASNIVEDQLDLMAESVKNAEAGKRIVQGYGTSQNVIGTKSTFPSFYSSIGFKNKEDFKKTLETPSIRQSKLIDQAIKDIKAGKDYGLSMPDRSKDFEVATKQVYDNQNVIFRKLNGKIVPMKIKGAQNKFKAKTTVSDWDFDL